MALTPPREGARGGGNGPRPATIWCQGSASCSYHTGTGVDGPRCLSTGYLVILYLAFLPVANVVFVLFIFYCFTR